MKQAKIKTRHRINFSWFDDRRSVSRKSGEGNQVPGPWNQFHIVNIFQFFHSSFLVSKIMMKITSSFIKLIFNLTGNTFIFMRLPPWVGMCCLKVEMFLLLSFLPFQQLLWRIYLHERIWALWYHRFDIFLLTRVPLEIAMDTYIFPLNHEPIKQMSKKNQCTNCRKLKITRKNGTQ